jgi:hypothetical protein
MVTNQILLLSVIVSALFLGTFSLSHDSANADIDFCYDQVGDGHYCFEKTGQCAIASRDNNMAETTCYGEG